ncbi:hypothetical protein ACG3SL_11100 [Sphingomonas sp. CJ20]
MRVLGLFCGLIALGGCGSDAGDNANTVVPTPTPTPGPSLGGIDLNAPLRVSGAGKSWTIDISPGTILYTPSAKPSDKPIDFYPITPKVAGDAAVFVTQTPTGAPVTITLRNEKCAEQQQPLRAEAKIGARTLTGCAGLAPKPGAEGAPANATG